LPGATCCGATDERLGNDEYGPLRYLETSKPTFPC
jgi:hypothetical protein